MTVRYVLAIPAALALLAGCAAEPGTVAKTQQLDRDETDALSIENALSAAPADVARNATVKLPNGEVLRAGSNGWVCLPDHASQAGNSPRCLDEQYQAFIKAYQQRKPPKVERVGFGYMLQGGKPGSDTHPYATGPDAPGLWFATPRPPHLMAVVPTAEALKGLPKRSGNGGPWVMWADTPYAHIMIPVAASDPASH